LKKQGKPLLFLLSAIRSAQSLKTQVGNLLSLLTHSLAVKGLGISKFFQSFKKVAGRHFFELFRVSPLALAPGRQNPQGTKT
jgi:hypothetical protein